MANEEGGPMPLTATVGERLGEKLRARQEGGGAAPDPVAELRRAQEAPRERRERGERGHRGGWHAAGWLAFFSAVGTWVVLDALARSVGRRLSSRVSRRRRRRGWRLRRA